MSDYKANIAAFAKQHSREAEWEIHSSTAYPGPFLRYSVQLERFCGKMTDKHNGGGNYVMRAIRKIENDPEESCSKEFAEHMADFLANNLPNHAIQHLLKSLTTTVESRQSEVKLLKRG